MIVSINWGEMVARSPAEKLISTVLEMDGLGFSPGSTGNISERIDSSHVAITPSGVPYRDLVPENIVVVDMDGRVVEGELEPSSDLPVHLAVYRSRPDAVSVLHCHPPFATALACLRLALPPVHYMSASLAPDGIVEVAQYACYGTEELGKNVTAALGNLRSACLLANHGVVCLGDSPGHVLSRAVTLDWLSGVYLRTKMLSLDGPPLLSQSEVTEVAEKLANYGRENQARLQGER